MAVVAVFGGIHSAAREIAQRVAEALGYAYIGEELLQEAADTSGLPPAAVERSMAVTPRLLDVLTHEPERAVIYLRAALAKRLNTDALVFYSPAVHLIPDAITHVLKVCIVAPNDHRVARAKATGIDEATAERQIAEGDRARGRWTDYLFGKGPWDPSLYDLRIALPEKSVDEAVALVVESAQRDALRPTPSSLQAVVDLLLATRVNVALVEEGYPYCDVTCDDGHASIVVKKKQSLPGTFGRALHALKLDQLEKKLSALALSIDGVTHVDVRPGPSYSDDVQKVEPRFLLVDDEHDYVTTLSERLEVRDMSADIAFDGEQALSYVNTDEPDVMVLDLKMPGIDGLEVLRRVRRDHPRVQVIILTGHGNEGDEKLARELGAFEYLTKPVDITMLAETMKRASTHAEALRETDDDEG